MKALLKEGGAVSLSQVPRPEVERPDDVLLRVVLAGICRTDIYAARGELNTRDPLILGHELCGVIEAVGTGVSHLHPDTRCAVMPVLGCLHCPTCTSGQTLRCPRSRMLGIDAHGGFAEYVVVPARAVFPLPTHVSDRRGAYFEPIAASLAALQVELAGRVVIYGDNRIARLTATLVQHLGGVEVALQTPGEPMAPNSCDTLIETRGETQAIAAMIEALRPGGTLVVKSRPALPVSLDWARLVHKEIRLVGVRYGDLEVASRAMADPALPFEALFGDEHPLEDFHRVFDAASKPAALKHFFRISDA